VVFIITPPVLTYSLFERVAMLKIELTLPDLPEGYEYTGEYRRITKDELFPEANGSVLEWVYDYKSHFPHLVVVKTPPPYTPPKGVFKPGWLAVDTDGTVSWFASKPIFWPDSGDWELEARRNFTSIRSSRIEHVLNKSLLPPANLRGVKAIWEIKE
jgi:hypothetical protein